MTITRNVVTDLWPLYESNEASADSRRLIETFLRDNPEFAQLIRESPRDSVRADVLPPLIRDKELDTVHRAKQLVRIREVLFGIAIFLTATPFTMYDTSWGSGWVIRDQPWLALCLAVCAVVAWCGYLGMRRRLSATGL